MAKGKFAGYVEAKVSPHDLAAIEVIVTEAGGRVSTMDGQPLDYLQGFDSVIVSNGVTHDQLIQLINKT